ncbi:MAG: hypothetical protein LKF98_04780 [Microbacteriaceae bacterium]|nr:hypothetical protein [Microbacteriaceae bacterium]
MHSLGAGPRAGRRSGRRSPLLPILCAIAVLLSTLTATPAPTAQAAPARQGISTPAADAPGQPPRNPRPLRRIRHLPGTVRFRTFRLSSEAGLLHPNAPDIAHAGRAGAPLLLFLPATGAIPQDYRRILTVAVRLGYSVLGLDYWNLGASVTRTCRSVADCYTRLQRNRFTGQDPGRFSRVNAANSIRHRLLLALRVLKAKDPNGGWANYFHGTTIRWGHIVLAGHSQGGGESAFISHSHRVRGVLMFSSPVETYDDVVASWMEHPGKTPARDMYALDSTNDIYADRIVRSWPHLGLNRLGATHTARTPTGSHRLVTTLHLGDPHQAHDRTATDATPLTHSGTPKLQRTWRWMLEQTL